MRLKRVLLTAFAGLFLLCGVALLWLFNSDLGRFQPQIQSYLSKQLNREVTLDTLSLELGWPTRLSVSGLSVANASWAGKAPLLHIDRLEGAVDLWSLVSRDPIIVERLDGDGIRLLLAWNEEGATNFQFGLPGDAPASSHTDRPRLILREVSVAASSVNLVQPGHMNHIAVDQLSLADTADGMLTAGLEGTVNDQPLSFTGELSTFDALLDASNVRLDGAGQFARLNFRGTALVDDLKKPNRPVMDLQISGPDIGDIERFLGLKPAVAGAFKAHITSTVDDSAGWKFAVSGQAGEFTIQSEGTASGLQDLSTLSVSARGSGPNLQSLVSLFGIREAPAQPFELSGSVTRKGPVLALKDIVLTTGPTRLELNGDMNHFPHVRGSHLKLQVTGPEMAHLRGILKLPGIAEGPFDLSAELMPMNTGEEQLSVSLNSPFASIEINGSLTSHPAYLGSTLQVELSGKSAAAILDRFSVPGVTATPFTASSELTIGDGMVTVRQGTVTGLYNGDLTIDGDIGIPFPGGKTQLDLKLVGPNLQRSLSNLWKDSPAREIPFEIQTQLQGGTGQILLTDLALRAGPTAISATARIPLVQGVDGLDIGFDGKGPDLKAFLRGRLDLQQTPLQVPDQPWAASGQVRKQADRFTLTDLRLQVADLDAEGSASFPWPLRADQVTFKLSASGADLAAIVPVIGDFSPSGESYSVDLEGVRSGEGWQIDPSRFSFAGATLNFGGNIDGLPDFSSTDFSLSAAIPNLQTLGSWTGAPLPRESLGLNARLSGSVEELSLQKLEVQIGKSKLQGQLTLKPQDARMAFKLRLNSDSLDLRGIMPSKQSEVAAAEHKAGDDGRLISDATLDFGFLKSFDGEVNIDIAGLILPDRIVDELAIDATLDQGSLLVQRYHSKGLEGEVNASGSLRVLESGGARITVELGATELIPNRQDWKDADPATLPRFNVSLSGNSSGASWRTLAAGLNGQVDLVASEGFLPGRGLGALNAMFLEQLISFLAPGFNSQQPTELLCMAARLSVVDGLVKTDPMIALQTSKLLLESTGTLDLNTERLELDFETTPTKLLSTSISELINPFVTIRGTLAKPSPTINPASTLFYGGAAAATGGLSLVAKGLWNRLLGTAKPCQQLREELRKDLAAKQAGQ